MFSQEQLERAAAGDLEALAALDARGLFLGPDETPEAFADRLRGLAENSRELDAELATKKMVELGGLKLPAADRIPPELFSAACRQTEELFAFAIDWVPGFYVTPAFGWLFAGCAYSFAPQFFSMFIISKKFASREKWLIYSRRELLAHELCHVARGALASPAYEELFAYKTAGTGFRRELGGVFHRAADSFMVLGSVLALLACEVARVFVSGIAKGWTFGLWGVVVATLAFLGGRQMFYKRRLAGAVKLLRDWPAGDRAGAVVFRCTDREILELGSLTCQDGLAAWLAKRTQDNWRWRVIARRFLGVPWADAKGDNGE